MSNLRFLACLLALSLSTACATSTGKVAGGVAAGSVALGALTMSGGSDCRDDCADANLVSGMVFGGTALVALAVAVVAEAGHHENAPSASAAPSTSRLPPCPPAAAARAQGAEQMTLGLRCR
jgi:hypothetical protein